MSEKGFSFLPPSACERPYTISEINDGIALILESGNSLVWAEGEVSGCKVSTNGHCYLRLKDPQCQVPAVIWRSTLDRMKFRPEDGMAVLLIAELRVYRRGGYYQLDIQRMEPLGRGELWAEFERLKKKLGAEGLFDHAHKKPLPASVSRLGVITSRRGAAIHDIVKVTATRSPAIDIVLIDVPVQGDTAASKIAAAIRDMNSWGRVDCIIVGRGGGSAEDLMPFSDEAVARAIYESEIPVISAVGHEIDVTIADFVADVRAPTPSAAAEIAIADREDGRRLFESGKARFSHLVGRYFDGVTSRFSMSARSRALRRPMEILRSCEQSYDNDTHRFALGFAERFRAVSAGFASCSARLNSLSPLKVLDRGYSVAMTESGQTIRNASQISAGDPVFLRFLKGKARGRIEEVWEKEPSKESLF